jgi:LysR family transcriptional regulator, transcriptional activator for bauABCD operon
VDRKPKFSVQEEQRFLRQVDWNLFRQFFEIASAGSVSAAARKLNMHQPGLSTSLKRLEEQVGTTLCHRTAQGVELTPAGKVVMQQVADVFEAIRMVPHLAAQASKRIEGMLRIAMISDIISAEFDEALSSIMRRHSDVKLTIDILTWREVLEAVSSGQSDIGVTYESDALPNLRYEPFVRESQQLYCGRWHPLYGHLVRNPATLVGERFIFAAADEPAGVKQFRTHFDIGKNTTAHADDLYEAMRLIRLGLGIGFLPTIVADQIKGELWPILPTSFLPSYLIYLITPTNRQISTPAQMFRDEVLRRLRARPDFS